MRKRNWMLLLWLLVAVSTGHAVPVSALQGQQPPAQIVAAFLDAWNQKDLEAMYSYVSPQSKEFFPLQVFRNRYEVAHTAINFAGVTYTLGETTIQGITAAVRYSVKIESPLFGTIDDPGRTMRLVQTGEGWRIAWTSMDIFDALASEARIRVDSRFPARANIYDRDGQPLVQQGGTVVVLYAAKQNMSNVDDCINLLTDVLRRWRPDLVRDFNSYLPETIFYLGEVDPEVYDARRRELEEICGIYETSDLSNKVERRQTRHYYRQGIAAHVTGYIGRVPADRQDFWLSKGYQPGDLVGLYGMEAIYEEVLAGKAERFLRITEPGGTTLRELGNSAGAPPAPITLTIDRDLQAIVAQALSDAYNYAQGNWGSISAGAAAVVIDVNNGDVLALASYPPFDPGLFNPDTYDPNALERVTRLNADPRLPFRDKATQEQYSPGSVFKIVTTAAAANEGIFGLDEVFYCDLTWDGTQLGDTLPSRSDWRLTDGLEPAGDITISQALTSSCDPFFYQMGALLYRQNPNLLVTYAQRMGLGSLIGLQIEEVPGNLAPPRSAAEAINNAIGQGGVQIPPIQMTQLVAAVANGGTLYKTHLVKRVGGADGAPLISETTPAVVRDLGLKPEVIDVIKKGMCDVTTDRNLGTAEFVFGNTPYTVCGKTGTAQTAQYPNAWFVAYAPAENPQIAVTVLVAQSREGSEVAAPIVRRILDLYFNAKVEPFPEWWAKLPYIPLAIPEGGTGGG